MRLAVPKFLFPLRGRFVAVVVSRGDKTEDDGHAEHHSGIKQEAAAADGGVIGRKLFQCKRTWALVNHQGRYSLSN